MANLVVTVGSVVQMTTWPQDPNKASRAKTLALQISLFLLS